MKKIILLITAAMLSGCITLGGTYVVSARTVEGEPVRVVVKAHGSGIYTARNAFCSSFPGATVTIVDVYTGEELASESPYHCR